MFCRICKDSISLIGELKERDRHVTGFVAYCRSVKTEFNWAYLMKRFGGFEFLTQYLPSHLTLVNENLINQLINLTNSTSASSQINASKIASLFRIYPPQVSVSVNSESETRRASISHLGLVQQQRMAVERSISKCIQQRSPTKRALTVQCIGCHRPVRHHRHEPSPTTHRNSNRQRTTEPCRTGTIHRYLHHLCAGIHSSQLSRLSHRRTCHNVEASTIRQWSQR